MLPSMWLFTRYGFFSIAAARRLAPADPPQTMIRARQRRHLENLRERFPALAAAEVQITEDTDYRYRLIVPKTAWTRAVAELAEEQTWSNFKSECRRHLGSDYADYERALHRVWDTMNELQSREPGR